MQYSRPANNLSAKRLRLLCAATTAALALLASACTLHAKVLLVAHRGGALEFPENTIAAFTGSQFVADFQEFDVCSTADGELVIIHDLSVDRTTNGTGNVSSLTLAQIRALDAGSKFNRNYAGEKVPTLSEGLSVIQRYSAPFLEVKSGSVAQYAEALRRQPLRPEGIVMSFSYNFVVAFKREMPSVQVGWVGSGPLSPTQLSEAVAAGITHFIWPSPNIDKATVDAIHASNCLIFAWTVNDLADMRRLVGFGVDGIITDRPKLFSTQPEIASAISEKQAAAIDRIVVLKGRTAMLFSGVLGRLGKGVEWRRSVEGAVLAVGPSLAVRTDCEENIGTYVAQWNDGATSITRSFLVQTITGAAGLSNISSRVALSGSFSGIAGFIVANDNTGILLRGVGPSLADFGVPDAVRNPSLDIFAGPKLLVSLSSQWELQGVSSEAFVRNGAFALRIGSNDLALEQTFPAGAYTAVLGTSNADAGTGLLEVYQDGGALGNLRNISVRARTIPGNPMVVGFVVSGESSCLLLIRGIGPSLKSFNIPDAIRDPVVRVFRSDGALVAANDDGFVDGDARLVMEATAQVGAFPLRQGGRESELLLSLPAGAYTATIEGAGGWSAGTALIELYVLETL